MNLELFREYTCIYYNILNPLSYWIRLNFVTTQEHNGPNNGQRSFAPASRFSTNQLIHAIDTTYRWRSGQMYMAVTKLLWLSQYPLLENKCYCTYVTKDSINLESAQLSYTIFI